jgi:hypothetical protein
MSKNKVTFKMPPLGKQYANQNKQAMNKQKNMVQNPVTKDEATTKITEMIQQSGIPPKMFVKIGNLAEAAINDKKKYSKFVDFMVKEKLETRESLAKADVQMLASMVVIGKVAETLPDKMDEILPKGSVTESTEPTQQVSGPVAPTQLEGL